MNNVEEDSTTRGSQAIHRALRILHCWNENEPTLTITDVAKKTKLTLPTAHRMIKALQDEGFLAHDSASGRYSIGPAIARLAWLVMQRGEQDELPIVAMPHLERMRAIADETVGLHLPMADSRICVAELVSRQPIRAATGVGHSFPLPAGAAGKVLVAWSPERLGMTKPVGSKSQQKAFESELAQIVKQGYAMSEGETIVGARGLAIPILGARGRVDAAINVTGPANRWTEKRMKSVLPELLEEVAEINVQLGYR